MIRFLALFILLSFAVVGAVLYTPALPAIVQELGISKGQSQLSVTLFLLAYAFGQLPYGPLGNALGRRRSVYLGSLLAVIGSLLCAWASGFALLAVGRVIAGLGMACGLVTTFTVVGDLYERREAHRMISFLVLSFGVMPGLGVALGGFLTEYLGWRSCFYFLAAYSLLIAGLTSRLPRTGPAPDIHHLNLLRATLGWWKQLRDLRVILGGSFIGLATMLVYLFAADAPFIAISKLGISSDGFGLLNLSVYSGFVVGGLLSSRLGHFDSARVIAAGMTLIVSCAALLLILFSAGWINLWTLFLPVSLLYVGVPVVFTPVTAQITSEASDTSNASSVMTFLQMIWPTIGVLLMGSVMPAVPLSLPILIAAGAVLMIPVYGVLRKATR